MKPSFNLLCSVIFLSMSPQLLHAAADITIGSAGNVDITPLPTTIFKDATDNGGLSNLNVSTLVSALGLAPALVTTNTSTSVIPTVGEIKVLVPITWATSNTLSLNADANILVGATTTNAAGGGFSLTSGTGVAFNTDVILSGGVSQLSVVSSGISQLLTKKLLIGGLADLNAGAGNITLPEANNFGSLKLAGGAVTVNEVSSTLLTGVSAGSLNLTSSGAITDSGIINVTGLATLSGTSINLGGGTGEDTSFGSLNFTSAGAVTLQLDSGTTITGTNTASTFTLNTTGVSAFAAGATLNATSLDLQGGTLGLSGSNLVSTIGVTVGSGATLHMNSFNQTVSSFTLNNGILAGTGTLTTSIYALNGGTVNANLGAGTLSQLSNITTLNGTSGTATVNVTGGTLTLGASDRLSNSAAVTVASGATLNMGVFNDTVGAFTLNNGILAGTGTLTTTTYALNGGTVNANLGTGTLNQLSNTTTLNGTSGAVTVNVTGGTLTLGASDRLSNSAAVTVASGTTLNMGIFNDTVGAFTLNNGILAGTGTLTGASYALNGGTVNANLGTGTLSQLSNTTTLNGTSGAATVNVSGGILALGASDRLSNAAAVTVASGMTLNMGTFNDTVGAFTLNNGTLAGTGTLTATTYALNGGTVNAKLGTGTLNQLSNTTTLNGTSGAATVNVSGGTLTLGASDRLSNAAAVTVASGMTLNMGIFNDTVGAFTLNNGILAGSGILTATTYALNGGTVNANLGTGTLNQLSNTTTLSGTSGAATVNVTGGTLTLGALDRLSNAAAVTVAATLNMGVFSDTVDTFVLNAGGLLAGSGALTATNGATLNGGTVSGHLLGDAVNTGSVLIDAGGSVGGGFLHVDSGILTLAGTANSTTTISAGATLQGTGLVNGDLTNSGKLAVGSAGGTLTISGNLATIGKVALSLNGPSDYEQIKAGSANLGGILEVTNTGTGLSNNQVALLIDAGSYSNQFVSFNTVGFTNGLLFNDSTGMLIGLGGPLSGGGYLNLTASQTNIYVSLFDDSVEPGVKNVSKDGNVLNFTSGISNGDAQLVSALNQATFATPGTINMDTINRLSPEVHRGMADYTEQALRSHVRQAEDAAPVSRKGRTQVFATVHSNSAGADDSSTNAGYDTDLIGVTTGARYDLNANFRIGGLLGMDGGTIKGALIDTDAQGFVLGGFGRYMLNDAGKTTISGSVSYGNYDYDAARRSFGGDARADGISSDAIELVLGVSTSLYDKDGFRVSPGGALRYATGGVDGFVENGQGVALAVGSQDIDSLLFDIGVDFSYQIEKRFSLVGRLGYIHDFSDSEETMSANFVATGSNGLPFSVLAPGIDNQAITLGLGVYYDINDSTRVGATYGGDFRMDSPSSHSFGVGVSYGF